MAFLLFLRIFLLAPGVSVQQVRESPQRLLKKAHLRRRLSSEGGVPNCPRSARSVKPIEGGRTSPPKFARAKPALERGMRSCRPATYNRVRLGRPNLRRLASGPF